MVKTYTEVFQNRPVELRFETIGRDLMVICSGGDRAHIGSLSLAQPYREAHAPACRISACLGIATVASAMK